MPSPADTLRLLRLAMWLLLSAGLLVLAVPIPVPLPVRLATASVDLIAAAVVWLALRQRREK
jgi:hypothetical protein